jgi:AcrR family transcriptional regulator
VKTKNSKHAGTAVRRREIIQAALACFTELGFTQTGMADIRRRSKASTGSIYHHFKSKEQLAARVYLEGIRDYQEGFVAALEEQEFAREGIFAVVNYHLKWVANNPEWAVYLFQKRYAEFMGSTDAEVERLNGEFTSRCAKWFSRQVRTGKLRRLPPDLYGAILIGPCMEYCRKYTSGQARTSIDRAIPELASIAWRSLSVELQGE